MHLVIKHTLIVRHIQLYFCISTDCYVGPKHVQMLATTGLHTIKVNIRMYTMHGKIVEGYKIGKCNNLNQLEGKILAIELQNYIELKLILKRNDW